MSRTVGKALHKIDDIWVAYANKLLKDNPEWWSYRGDKHVAHYIIYRREGTRVIEVLSYPKFRKVMEYYLDKAKQAIINGDALDMTNGVGKIHAKRVQRDFRKKKQRSIDWHKTRNHPNQELIWSEEEQKHKYKLLVYFTNDDWCRIGWNKTAKVVNQTAYEFKPTAPNADKTGGFILEFTRALDKDPLLRYKYLYNPVRV